MTMHGQPGLPVLVILGGWNPNILVNKKWLERYLFPQEKVDIKIPIGLQAGPPIIEAGLVQITVAGNILSIIPKRMDDSILELIQETSTKLADYLPHTPVGAVGVNFVFAADAKRSCSDWFETSCLEKMGDLGRIKSKFQKFAIATDNGYELNVTIHFKDEEPPVCDMNFHHAIEDIMKIKEIFDNRRIAEYYEEAKQVAENIFATTEEG